MSTRFRSLRSARLALHGRHFILPDQTPMPTRRLLIPVCSLLLLVGAVSPSTAEEGFFDRLLGGTPGAAPANPFASNYPSAPPSRSEVRAARDARAVRRERGAEAGPVPPGRIPEE
jgi:hypothetical protein